MVPTFTTYSIDGVGAQLFPCSIATSTPQTFPVASPPTALGRLRSLPPATIADGVRCDPAHIHQVRAGVSLEGVQPLVHFRYAFLPR